jgi:hypothetical protein
MSIGISPPREKREIARAPSRSIVRPTGNDCGSGSSTPAGRAVSRRPSTQSPDPEPCLPPFERADVEQRLRIDGDVVVAEAHQEELDAAHGRRRPRPPRHDAGVIDAVGARRPQALAGQEAHPAASLGRAPVPDGADVRPAHRRILERGQMLRAAARIRQALELAEQRAGIEDHRLGACAQRVGQAPDRAFVGPHGAAPDERHESRGQQQYAGEPGDRRPRQRTVAPLHGCASPRRATSSISWDRRRSGASAKESKAPTNVRPTSASNAARCVAV